MNIFTWKFGRREHGNKKKKEKKIGGSIRSIVKNEISPVVSGGNNVEFLGGSLLMSFRSEIKVTSDSLIYFDNHVIIDDRASHDKTFVNLKRYYYEIHCINQRVKTASIIRVR